MNSYERIYNILVEMRERPLKTDRLTGMIFRHTKTGKILVRTKPEGSWQPLDEKPVDEKPKKK